MPKPKTDEQFPLLLVLVGDQELSKDNKRFSGKGRFDGITSGATAIITKWPNYLSSCWVTALLCGICLFTMSILMSSCMRYQQHPRLARCSSDNKLQTNGTIHLIHPYQTWTYNQDHRLKLIMKAFPDYEIRLTFITENSFKWNKTERIFEEFPKVVVNFITFDGIFNNSPLFLNWVSLNPKMKIFAARVLQIWHNGGLSFDMLSFGTNLNSTTAAETKFLTWVVESSRRYEKLDPLLVSIDKNGFHMGTKTPCHVFFEKILSKLRKGDRKLTPKKILNGPIYTFCRLGLIDRAFCKIRDIFVLIKP